MRALARLTERRFQSFSEAADAVLDLLEDELPADAIMLGLLDPEALRALEVKSYLAVPFETSDGSGAVTLCALGAATGVFTTAHLDLLAISGRLLTYEWESVRWRAEVRRMSQQLQDPRRTDHVTGLPNRESLMATLEREWRVARRGPVESYVLVCRATDYADVGERAGEAVATVLLKDMAEVLGGAIRRSDHIGRTAEDELAVVLVGCKGRAGADALFERFAESFASVTSTRPATLAVGYGVCELAAAPSAKEAFEQAAAGARRPAPVLSKGR